jgi:hypothetical protein
MCITRSFWYLYEYLNPSYPDEDSIWWLFFCCSALTSNATLTAVIRVKTSATTTITVSRPVKTLGTSLSARDNASTIRSLVKAAKSADVLLDAAMAAFFAEEEESWSKLLPLLPTKE